MPRGNVNNLKKTLTAEEARELGRKGGKKSGEVRAAKKTMRETLSLLLDLPLKSGDLKDLEKIKSLAGLSGQNVTVQTALLLAQLKKALAGDNKAFSAIIEIINAPNEQSAKSALDKLCDTICEAVK